MSRKSFDLRDFLFPFPACRLGQRSVLLLVAESFLARNPFGAESSFGWRKRPFGQLWNCLSRAKIIRISVLRRKSLQGSLAITNFAAETIHLFRVRSLCFRSVFAVPFICAPRKQCTHHYCWQSTFYKQQIIIQRWKDLCWFSAFSLFALGGGNFSLCWRLQAHAGGEVFDQVQFGW